jgi:hypothetical protein
MFQIRIVIGLLFSLLLFANNASAQSPQTIEQVLAAHAGQVLQCSTKNISVKRVRVEDRFIRYAANACGKKVGYVIPAVSTKRTCPYCQCEQYGCTQWCSRHDQQMYCCDYGCVEYRCWDC